MNPDLKESLPREILEEFNGARGPRPSAQGAGKTLQPDDGSGAIGVSGSAEPYERTSRAGATKPTGFKGQDGGHAGGTTLKLKIPQVKALVILPEVVGARLPLGEGLKAGHCRDVRQGSLHSQGEPDHGATVWDRDLGQPGLDRESPHCWMESWSSSGKRELGAYRVVYLECPLREGAREY